MLNIRITSLVALVLFSNFSYSQDSTLIKIKARNYPVVKNHINTYYSAGNEKKAKEINELISKADKYFSKELQVKATYDVALLNKTDWEGLTYLPYQVFHVSDSPHVIFLPAVFDDGPNPPSEGITVRLKSKGFTFAQALTIISHFRALHELGHLVAEKMPISYFPGKPNKWYNEFIASFLAYSYYSSNLPKEAEVIRIMSDHSDEKKFERKYGTLEDFEKLYSRVGPENYGWYQNQFLKLVYNVYDKKKIGFLKEIQKSSFNRNEKIPIADLLSHLEGISPGFVAWGQGLK